MLPGVSDLGASFRFRLLTFWEVFSMLEKSGAAMSRWARLALAVVLLAFGAGGLWAQGTTGKIEGTVTDPNGQPVVGAQVIIVGTAAGATTSSAGYYFINNVPAGVYTLRAQMIGFSPNEVRNARVLADQTLTVNFSLSGATVLGAISVTVQQNPIVPRDQVTSKSIVTGNVVNDMPVDNVRSVLSLQPGVVESGKGDGLSIRGGRAGEAAVYVDGALVRSELSGGSRLNVGTNSLEEASVTTGALGAEFGEAQSGVIAYVTKGGTSKLSGAASYETDEPFGKSISVGLNRAELSIGGPIMSNLTFYLSAQLQGRQSGFRGKGGDVMPSFVLGGLDTTVIETEADGSTKAVDIPRFVQYSGVCDATLNYGYECQGRRQPYNWTTNATGQAKLQYTYGSGSRVSATALYSQDQGRNWNTGFNYNLMSGNRAWSNGFIANWTQQVFRQSERELAFDVNLSYQTDRSISGQLDPAYELAHRDPFNGWVLSPMQFRLDFDHFSDDSAAMYGGADSLVITSLNTGADWDRLIRNVRTNQGTRLPYWNRTELNTGQAYRMNPWSYSTGYSTSGLGNFGVTLYQEQRLLGRANVDWQFDRYNRFKFGGDVQKSRVNYFNSGVISQIFQDIYSEKPARYGLYGQDRLDLGDVVIEVGLRYDYFNTGAYIPVVPGRIFTNPNFTLTDYLNPADSVFMKVTGHKALSPRVLVSFPVTDRTGFRLSYAHQVQSPDLQSIYAGINNDLAYTNTNDNFPRDVTWGKTILFEFGIRHAFSQDFVFDISAYNKDKVSDLAARIEPFYDPATDKIMNVNVLTNADFGNSRGVDMSLISRVGDFFNGTLTYTYQVAKSTGTDPFSYLNTTSRATLAVTGERVDPPQALLPFGENRTHNISGALAFSFPNDFASGSWYGSLLKNGGAFLRFRFASGLPYTKLLNSGGGPRAPFEAWGLSGVGAEPVNSSTMPWIKELDLRLTKGLRLAGADWTVFADVRNLLNLTSITSLFIETGDVVNAVNRQLNSSPEVSRLVAEAGSNAVTQSDGSVSIMLPADCNAWGGGPVNCVLLKRSEARFGNGDGTFTQAEYIAMWDSEYDIFNGVYTFYAAPRSIRLGFELRF
jgi:hypothetical protein